jgi:hypothetical protein
MRNVADIRLLEAAGHFARGHAVGEFARDLRVTESWYGGGSGTAGLRERGRRGRCRGSGELALCAWPPGSRSRIRVDG